MQFGEGGLSFTFSPRAEALGRKGVKEGLRGLKITYIMLDWELEYRARFNFKWSKVVQMLNGFDFKWHSKTEQPNHSKSDQIANILDSSVLVPF